MAQYNNGSNKILKEISDSNGQHFFDFKTLKPQIFPERHMKIHKTESYQAGLPLVCKHDCYARLRQVLDLHQ